jgi:ATP-dependent Clp protease ATP-binding subunit ClpA
VRDRDRFDKFTERARKVLSLAQEEAQRFQHNYIGTEHLLLGLVREGEGVAAKVLTNLGVQLSTVRNAVEFIIGRGDRIVLGEIGLTPRAKKVIELAVDEARRLNHHYIGTEHLLLGLVREGEGIAAGVLESLGVNLEKVRGQTIMVLSQVSGKQAGQADQKDLSPSSSPPGEGEASNPDVSTPDQQSSGQGGNSVKFDTLARNVLRFAQEEAQLLQHNYIGTEHLLLGLLRETGGGAAKVLNHLGIELEKARETVVQIIGRGDRIILGEIGLTPRAKKVVEFAVDEARRLNQQTIVTEHLLLGIVRLGDGIAVGVLESLGVNLEKVRADTLDQLK